MNKLRISLLLVMFMSIAVNAKKLSGEEFRHAVDLLIYALDQLSAKSNTKLISRNINSASEVPSGDGIHYEGVLVDDKNKEHKCKIEITSVGKRDSKIVCKCPVMKDLEATFN
ncbi:uncharacterized protein ACRADG_001235 [Cochliomyia hominivorax]